MSAAALKVSRLLATAACLTALAGCAGPQLYLGQLKVLDKGLSPSQAVTRLEQQPRASQSVEANGRSFLFQRYRLYNGLNGDVYFLAYERDRLLYWGYISEFRRQPDRDLNAALTTAIATAPLDAP